MSFIYQTQINLQELQRSKSKIINKIFYKHDVDVYVNSLQILYQQELTSGNCANLLKTDWKPINRSFSDSDTCNYNCKRSDSGTVQLFAPEMKVYYDGIEVTKSITDPYSIVGIDFIYLIKSGFDLLNVGLYDTDYLVRSDFNQGSKGMPIEMNYNLDCSFMSDEMQVSKAELQYNNIVKNNKISARFIQTINSGRSWYGILKVRLWANCVENCLVCGDNSNCLKCIHDFVLYTMPTGEKVCEQTQNCNISNCFSCIKSKSSPSTVICVRCLPGYSLNSSKQCIQDVGTHCSTGSYYSAADKACSTYSTICFYQQQRSNFTWLECNFSLDIQKYQCAHNKQLLLFEHRNYQLYNCGCKIQFCDQCPLSSYCQQCSKGYIYNSTSQQCIFDKCDEDETQNPNTKLCEKNCIGQNCVKCTPTDCTQCKTETNYYIDSSTKIDCHVCTIVNCKKCSGDGLCEICQAKHSLSLDKKSCYPCDVDNCKLCSKTDSKVCDQCVLQYLPQNQSTQKCECGVKNCLNCQQNDGSLCENCQTNYKKSDNSSFCNCQVNHCSECDPFDGKKCITCKQNFYPEKDENGIVVCKCKENCSSCSDDGLTCLKCVTGYDLPECKCIIQNCQKCDPLNGSVCQTCQTNYKKSDNSTACNCQVNHCSECDPFDGKKCIACKQNFYPEKDENGVVVCKCKENCSSCSDDGLTCLKCVTGYDLPECKCIIQNCQKCDPLNGFVCQICQDQYKISASGECKLICPFSNCNKCADPPNNLSLCQVCSGDLIWDSTKKECVPCEVNGCQQCEFQKPKSCKICSTGYQIDSDSPDMIQCILCNVKNCTKCLKQDSNICKTCVQGYIGSQCECQSQNCQLCDPDNGLNCSQCKNNFIEKIELGIKKCICAVQNCDSCNPEDGLQCLKCKNNYIEEKNNQDIITGCKCSINLCNKCNENDGSICTQCVLGYNTDKCTCSVNNCESCDPNNGYQCLKCKNNYTEKKNIQNIITECKCSISMCNKCIDNDGSICDQCVQDYRNDKDKCSCSVNNCDSCDPNNGKQCLKCKNNYTEQKNIQNIITDCKCSINMCNECNDTDGSICKQCVQGYKSDKCTCGVDNCEKCNPNDGTKCDKCMKNYYKISPQKCDENCPIKNCNQCDEENNQIICKKCKDKLVFNKQNQACEQCQASNCSECVPNEINKCQTCSKGFQIEDSSSSGGNKQFNCVQMPCQVQKCNKCQTDDPMQCTLCEKDFVLNNKGQCIQKDKNNFKFEKIGTFKSGYNITLTFDKQLVLANQDSLNKLLNINITDTQYTDLNLQKKNEKQISIDLILNSNCKNEKVTVQIKDSQFVQVNNLIKDNDEEKLPDFIILSEEQIGQAKAAQQVSQQISTTLMTTMLPIAMLGNFYVLFNTIDLTTLIYYLLFVKVRYPINITNFCSVFQNFQMAFIPNIFQVYFTDPGYIQEKTPEKFLEYGSDAYFLNGAGQSITIVLGIMSIYSILKIISWIPFPALQVYLKSKIESGWTKYYKVYNTIKVFDKPCTRIQNKFIKENCQSKIFFKKQQIQEYCAFFDLIWTVYMYVVVSVFLQFFCFEFTESLAFLSYSLFSMCLIAIFFIPICITIFITKTEDLSDTRIQKQFASLIGGLKIQPSKMSQIINPESKSEFVKSCNAIDQTGYGTLDLMKHQSSTYNDLKQKTNKNMLDEDDCSPDGKINGGFEKSMYLENQRFTKRQQRTYAWSKYTNVFLYFRKIIYAILIIFMYEIPYLQMFFISCLNLFLAVFYFYIRPHEKEFDNIRNGLSESFLIIMQITVCTLVKDSKDEVEQDRINTGWILIGCAGFILFMHIFTVIIDLFRGIIVLIKDLILILVKYRKVTPIKKESDIDPMNISMVKKMEALAAPQIATQIRSKNKRLSTVLFLSKLNSSVLKRNQTRNLTKKSNSINVVDVASLEKNPQIGSQVNIDINHNSNIEEDQSINPNSQNIINVKSYQDMEMNNEGSVNSFKNTVKKIQMIDDSQTNKKEKSYFQMNTTRSKFNPNWSHIDQNFEHYSIIFSSNNNTPQKKTESYTPENHKNEADQ